MTTPTTDTASAPFGWSPPPALALPRLAPVIPIRPVAPAKISLRCIRILDSEGYPAALAYATAHTFHTFAAADAALRQLAWLVDGFCNKTNVQIAWADGDTYSARLDLKHEDHDHCGNLLSDHVRDFCRFSSGRGCPPHMTPEHHRELVAGFEAATPGQSAGYAAILDGYQLDDAPGTRAPSQPCIPERVIIQCVEASRQAAAAAAQHDEEEKRGEAAARVAAGKASQLRWFWNGVKFGKGPLQKAHLSYCKGWEGTPAHVAVYAPHCAHFSAEVRAEYEVKNNTDSQTDYFEGDRFHVYADHPRFADVAAATIKGLERDLSRYEEKGWAKPAEDKRRDIAELRALISGTER